MVRVLVVTHPDRAKLASQILKAAVDVEDAMLGTPTPDHLIEQVKAHMVYFRELALGMHKRSRMHKAQPKEPSGE